MIQKNRIFSHNFVTAEYSNRITRGNLNCDIQIQANASGISADSVARIEGTGVYQYPITAVGTDWVEVLGDKTTEYPTDSYTKIKNSTGNDGSYQILSSSFDSTYTRVTFTTTLPSAVVDGDLGDGLNDRMANGTTVWTYTAA